MDNPIPKAARGWIYVAGIVLGLGGLVVSATLPVLGLDAWLSVVGVTASAITTLTATLSRANLADPSTGVPADDIEALLDQVKRLSNVEPDPALDPVGIVEEFAPEPVLPEPAPEPDGGEA